MHIRFDENSFRSSHQIFGAFSLSENTFAVHLAFSLKMDQRMIVKYLSLKKMIAHQIHNGFVDTFGFQAISYPFVTFLLYAEYLGRLYQEDLDDDREPRKMKSTRSSWPLWMISCFHLCETSRGSHTSRDRLSTNILQAHSASESAIFVESLIFSQKIIKRNG
jgi:hypothetical protein